MITEEEFWNRWYEADELDKVKIVEELKIEKAVTSSHAIATLVNSFFVDLVEYVKELFLKVLILLVSIIIVICSVAFGGLALYNHNPEGYRYTGKEVFYTIEEYQMFKEFLIQKGIRIEDMKALSSEPPILVSYEIIVPVDIPMPYSYEHKPK